MTFKGYFSPEPQGKFQPEALFSEGIQVSSNKGTFHFLGGDNDCIMKYQNCQSFYKIFAELNCRFILIF